MNDSSTLIVVVPERALDSFLSPPPPFDGNGPARYGSGLRSDHFDDSREDED